jgi:hypothetical protein
MKIEKEIVINDEPLLPVSTGKRKARLTYTGPKYLYLEYDNVSKKIQVLMHTSETPELEQAKEKLTPIDGREVIVIDAEDKTIAATFFWSNYTLSVDQYTEELPNGEIYTYEYSQSTTIGEIFNFLNMEWNVEKNDFNEYKFVIAGVTPSEMISSTDLLIEKINLALVENTTLTVENKLEIQEYADKLLKFKSDVESGIPHWKLAFPVCSIPY